MPTTHKTRFAQPASALKAYTAAFLIACLCSPQIATAQTEEFVLTDKQEADAIDEEVQGEIIAKEDGDGSYDDATGSIDITSTFKGFQFTPDVRALVATERDELVDGEVSRDNVLRIRARLRGQYAVTQYLRGTVRVAMLCTSDSCEPNPTLDSSTSGGNSIEGGDITLDEAYLHLFRLKKFDIAAGRMQTKFVARGGVFAKSLDRNNSNNTRVNWTDGIHATYRADNGWNSHFIAEYNSSDGSSSFNNGALDFSESKSRVSYFAGFENRKRTRFFLQRALDISYLPKTLIKDGQGNSAKEDYYAAVIRSANRWPEKNDGLRLRVAAELGYAPNTPTKQSVGLNGTSEADGLAWNVVASLMDFLPSQNIGFNYGHTGAGWLISPQYSPNTKLAEVRYQWRKNQNIAIELRYRHQKPLEKPTGFDGTLDNKDAWLRVTIAPPRK